MKKLVCAAVVGALAAGWISAPGGSTGNLVAANPAKGKPKETDATTRAIAYGESVIGAPYVWWKGGPLPSKAPMWTQNGPPPAPDVVRQEGTNCAGLTNLMLRSVGKRVPHAQGHGRGGTEAYAVYYEKVATKFDVKRKYPAGTLIGRNYRDVNDQGHVAVVLANGRVLQAIPDEGVNKTYTVRQSNGKGFYEYAVLPEDWLGAGGE